MTVIGSTDPAVVRPALQKRSEARGRGARLSGMRTLPAPGENSQSGRRRADDGAMDPRTLTLSDFQAHISAKYEAADRVRGTPGTWLWFSEEFGELARALARDDRANLESEFADVLAWLCTLANINDVDLASAVAKKYLGEGAPTGAK